MARSGQAKLAVALALAAILPAGCVARDGPGGDLVYRDLGDGRTEVIVDPAARERREAIERRRQDDEIRREIHQSYVLPPGLRAPGRARQD